MNSKAILRKNTLNYTLTNKKHVNKVLPPCMHRSTFKFNNTTKTIFFVKPMMMERCRTKSNITTSKKSCNENH